MKKRKRLIFNPIINTLKIIFIIKKENNRIILVPRNCLSIIFYEITKLGFFSYGLEVSYFMLIISKFLLNKIFKKINFNSTKFHSFNNLYKEDECIKNLFNT